MSEAVEAPVEELIHERAEEGGEILRIEGLYKHFPITAGVFKRRVGQVHAVDGVDLSPQAGATLGLVGESGCGKTTLGRTVIKLLPPTDGRILFNGQDITNFSRRRMREVRRELQIVFQDPYASLNPRMTVREIVAEPLRVHHLYKGREGRGRVDELLRTVGLSPEHANRFPHEFSGGQRQRIGLEGDVPNPANPPSGCRFRTRCWKAQPICAEEEPALIDRGQGHPSACHFAEIVKPLQLADEPKSVAT